MIWALLLALHLIGFVGYTLLLRKSALSSINKYLLAAVTQTAIFLPSTFFLVTNHITFNHSPMEWFTLLSSGAFLTGLQLLTILALKHLEASVWAIIFNLRLMLTTVFGYVFLSELPTKLQLLGGLVIFTSVILLNLHKNKRYAEKAILIGLAATVWFSLHATLEKYNVVNIGFEDYMFFAGLFATIATWTIAYVKHVRLAVLWRTVDAHTVRLLLVRTMSAWAYVLSLKYGSLAVTNYVSGMGVVFIVAFGVVWLGERTYLRQKIAATLTAVVGLTMILISKL